MLLSAIVIACWLLLAAFGWLLSVAVKRSDGCAASPSSRSDKQRAEDDEVAALDAIWELPARSPSQWSPPC